VTDCSEVVIGMFSRAEPMGHGKTGSSGKETLYKDRGCVLHASSIRPVKARDGALWQQWQRQRQWRGANGQARVATFSLPSLRHFVHHLLATLLLDSP
jgi:hypothetical protein